MYLFKKNYGSKSLWKSGVFYKYMFSKFCYTDSDLFIHEDCPNNFMEHFDFLLDKYKNCYKTGFSLLIDNLPDYYNEKQNVIKWESQFYKNEISIYSISCFHRYLSKRYCYLENKHLSRRI